MQDPSLIPGSGRFPGEGILPTPVFLPGQFHGWGSWRLGFKELDTTE